MKCKTCGGDHAQSYHLKKKLSDKGFPTHDKKYKSAHEEADKAEKRTFPRRNYKSLEKEGKSLPGHELLGKNTKSGGIEVSKVVPPKLRKEVAFHERTENEILRKKK